MRDKSQSNYNMRQTEHPQEQASVFNSTVVNSKPGEFSNIKSSFTFKQEHNPLALNMHSKLAGIKDKNEYKEILDEIRGYEGNDRSHRKGRKRKSQNLQKPEEEERSGSRSRSKGRVDIFGHEIMTEPTSPRSRSHYEDNANQRVGDVGTNQGQQAQNGGFKLDLKLPIFINKINQQAQNLDLRDVKSVNQQNINSGRMNRQRDASPNQNRLVFQQVKNNSVIVQDPLTNSHYLTFGDPENNMKLLVIPVKKDYDQIDNTSQYKSIRAQRVNKNLILNFDSPGSQFQRPIDFFGNHRPRSTNNGARQNPSVLELSDLNQKNHSIIIFDNNEPRSKRNSVQRLRNNSANNNSPARRNVPPPIVGIRSLLFDDDIGPPDLSIPRPKAPDSNSNDIAYKIQSGLSDIKNKFIDFRSYSCNCELIRLNDKKCYKASRILTLIKDSSPDQIEQTYKHVLKNTKLDEVNMSQIHKDIIRTYSNKRYFNNEKEKRGYERLERLLISISSFENIGYVQGMNFIAASMIWHCDEDISYIIIRELFIRIEAQNHYTYDLSGIQTHVTRFYYDYLRLQAKNVYECLENKEVAPQMILPEWFVTLGTSTVPLLYHADMIYMLIKHGWGYLYSVIRNYLVTLYEYYRDADFSETMGIVKNYTLDGNTKINLDWAKILKIN